jgi:hypothetical protein
MPQSPQRRVIQQKAKLGVLIECKSSKIKAMKIYAFSAELESAVIELLEDGTSFEVARFKRRFSRLREGSPSSEGDTTERLPNPKHRFCERPSWRQNNVGDTLTKEQAALNGSSLQASRIQCLFLLDTDCCA